MATSQYTDKTQLGGTLKEVYANEIKDLRLKVAVVQEAVPFKNSQLVGNNYHQPVIVTHNHGWFYDTSGGSRDMPDNPTAMQTKDLQVPAYEITERFRIPFGTIAALNAGNAASFFNTQTLKMLSTQKAILRDVEWSSLYGQQAIASVTACTAPSGGKVTFTLDSASISEAFIAGMEGAPLDAYTTGGSQLNTNATLVVTAIALGTSPTLTVSGNASDLTALNGASVPYNLFRRSTYGFEQPGIVTQAKNTGSLFGVTYSDYSLLLATQQTAVGQPSMKKVLDGVSKAQALGLEEEIELWAPPKGFNALMSDMAALRRIGGGEYKESNMKNGAEAVTFFSQSGAIKVVNCPFMKNGDMWAGSPKNLVRIGATDIVDKLGGEDLSVMQGSNNALEFRLFTNQCIVNIAPAQSIFYTGITFA
jgi:hypothetical protein